MVPPVQICADAAETIAATNADTRNKTRRVTV
jgi:hypothetical protein